MNEKLKAKGQCSRGEQEERKEMALTGVPHQLGNQNKDSDSGPRLKNCKQHRRIWETNKGLGCPGYRGPPDLLSL